MKSVRELFPSDIGFKFVEDKVEYPRAVIHINECCPDDYRNIVSLCQAKGWIKPIAYVPTKELVWEKLSK